MALEGNIPRSEQSLWTLLRASKNLGAQQRIRKTVYRFAWTQIHDWLYECWDVILASGRFVKTRSTTVGKMRFKPWIGARVRRDWYGTGCRTGCKLSATTTTIKTLASCERKDLLFQRLCDLRFNDSHMTHDMIIYLMKLPARTHAYRPNTDETTLDRWTTAKKSWSRVCQRYECRNAHIRTTTKTHTYAQLHKISLSVNAINRANS